MFIKNKKPSKWPYLAKKKERTGCSYTHYIHESQVHSKWKKPDSMLYEYVIAEKRKLESNESWAELG